ncbi:MAG: hypothetical protein PVF73_04565 [Bacteroidales bacterium]|jgi:hypothetical protein
MKKPTTKPTRKGTILAVLLLSAIFSLSYSAYYDNTETIFKFRSEYRIKRVPDGTVTIYTFNKQGEKEEYVFKDFNADVVLSVYRRIRVSQIAATMSKKYYLSESESRRGVKRVLNVLEQWDMITQ